MATMTKLTTMTWPSNDVKFLPAIMAARHTFIQSMLNAGYTDGIDTIISPTVTTRKWSTQEAADQWANFITTAATENGTSVNVAITDIV